MQTQLRKHNPSYAYQAYYLAVNIAVLNRLRRSKGLNEFAFRPHCGESGDVMHLAAAYLVGCPSVAHGIQLGKSPPLQYLYLLDQVGCAVSPISNNFLFSKLGENPFHNLFKRGLNVSLSTDDPLLFHMSADPLLEEYSMARHFWNLSVVDMCEIALNSVRQCGFTDEEKAQWVGKGHGRYPLHADGNDVTKTNVPPTRAQFRSQLLSNELKYVTKAGGELHGEEGPQGAADAAGGAAAKKMDAQEPTKGVRRRGRRASVELERLKSTHTIDEHIEATETAHSAHGISRFTAPGGSSLPTYQRRHVRIDPLRTKMF
eukprot:g2222.t1